MYLYRFYVLVVTRLCTSSIYKNNHAGILFKKFIFEKFLKMYRHVSKEFIAILSLRIFTKFFRTTFLSNTSDDCFLASVKPAMNCTMIKAHIRRQKIHLSVSACEIFQSNRIWWKHFMTRNSKWDQFYSGTALQLWHLLMKFYFVKWNTFQNMTFLKKTAGQSQILYFICDVIFDELSEMRQISCIIPH